MSLPMYTRAAALLGAVAVTATIVDVIAQIGHPGPGGYEVLSVLQPAPMTAGLLRLASVQPEAPVMPATLVPVAAPQP
jgi:hypothetical protein